MDGQLDETGHVIFSGKLERNKKYKEQILQEVIAAICAMLNSNGGKVIIYFDTDSSIPGESVSFSQISIVIRMLEQSVTSIIGLNQTTAKVNFRDDEDSVIIFVTKADFLVTINYNLYLPNQTQVVAVSPLESLENIKNDIMYRKFIPNPVQLGSHCQIFCKDENCGFNESKTCQFKCLKADQSKRTTLADRITGKGNKLSCYVSAFANYSGGHIYYGITSEKVVKGEFIPNQKSKEEITKKIEKAINKMIWPQQIGQPKRGKQWEIFFEVVVDKNCEPVPSTFVIVIYIASCQGGVFTEEPECYEMVDEKVQKMSFTTWKKRAPRSGWLCSEETIPQTVTRVTWSSPAIRQAFTAESEKLRKLINDGNWVAFSKECESPQKDKVMELLVLSKKITAGYRRGRFNNARSLLERYMTTFPKVKDVLIFEVVGLHLKAALKRANGDLPGVRESLTAALSKAELIEPGLVTATVYDFAATVSDLLESEPSSSERSRSDVLSIKALQHSQHAKDCPHFRADKEQKVHITLATFYLGCNLNGMCIKKTIHTSDLDKAKTRLIEVHRSTYDGNLLSLYREIQLNLVQSIYNYRHSQVSVNDVQKVQFLRRAFRHAKTAECLAKNYEFSEMLEWSKTNEALCTEELVRLTI